MADITAALIAEHRLVTLVGSGGVGKTRTSLQIAANLLDGSGDGERGHRVVVGTRQAAEHQDLAPLVEVASFDEAAAHGEVVVLAVRWLAVSDVIASGLTADPVDKEPIDGIPSS
jgi:predicted dinucleotide-binding enzyme